MKKNIIIMVCAISVFTGFNACKSKSSAPEGNRSSVSAANNSQSSLDWAGTYLGIVPCADCPGIETKLTLNQDGIYSLVRKYIDREGVFETKGTFAWNESGSAVTLTDANDNTVTHFLVGENQLTQLDMEGNVITGDLANNYIFTKVNPILIGNRWKLVELNGRPVERQDAFLILDTGNRISGNLGCNTFSGSYNLRIGNRIDFSQIVSTLKLCMDMEIEDGFKKVLEMTDNYNVNENGFVLNRARMAPLARFVLDK
jgi:uncharacterized lipoprotein NlpE involved in copper resistance